MGHGPVVGHDAVFSGPQSFSTINSISTINSKLRETWCFSLNVNGPKVENPCTKLFQTTGGRETSPALRMTTKMLIKQTSFVV